VTTSLEAFLLIGMSSHLSKLLIVYTEVIQIPRVQHMKQTVVSIITGKHTNTHLAQGPELEGGPKHCAKMILVVSNKYGSLASSFVLIQPFCFSLESSTCTRSNMPQMSQEPVNLSFC